MLRIYFLQQWFNLSDPMAEEALFDSEACAIVPILVVPADTLWQVDYYEDGRVARPVRIVDRSTLILRYEASVNLGLSWFTYDISHLEIVTLPALHQRVKNLIGAMLSDAKVHSER